MALRMVGLVRAKNGEFVARKGIPADVRVAYSRLYGVRWEAQLKLPTNTPRHEAKTLLAEWTVEVETRIATLRAEARGEGQPLTKVNAIALAGRWYVWFTKQQEDDPGSQKRWREMGDHLIWEVLYPEAPEEYHENTKADPHWEWAKEPEVRKSVRPQIAEMARVATFLASSGLSLNPQAHALFVDAVGDNLYSAIGLLERRAGGDYSPDTIPETFPAFIDSAVPRASGLDCWQLFEAFVKATSPAESTVQRWRAVFLNLQSAFSDTGAAAIKEAEARAWVTKLVSQKRSPKTVREVWLPAARRVFGWGEHHKHVLKNPFVGIKVDVPRRARNRETKAFMPAEARTILRATLVHKKPRSPYERAQRWAMWLCAYSGARAGEITQLRGSDIEKRGSIYVMKLTPDAGTIKTRQARIVPIHEHIISQGFLEAVRHVGKGPLFYTDSQTSRVKADPLNPRRTRAGNTRGKLGSWVRKLGVTDKELSPTHAWRHTFKQIAERAGIGEKVHDAITGHAPASEGRKYGPPTVEDMAAALKKFPRYKLD